MRNDKSELLKVAEMCFVGRKRERSRVSASRLAAQHKRTTNARDSSFVCRHDIFFTCTARRDDHVQTNKTDEVAFVSASAIGETQIAVRLRSHGYLFHLLRFRVVCFSFMD